MSEELFPETGERIKELRGTVTQALFAEQLGVDRKTVTRWEAGERLPDGKSLLALMKVFGADANYLLTGSRAGTAPVGDAAERMLLDAYRACAPEARRNLIATAALLSAGMAPAPAPRAPAPMSMRMGDMVSNHTGSVQVGYAGGKVSVSTGGVKKSQKKAR